tara:strand:+ start:660 stop:1847 length:1188 start_codon:yes stop_codon:yes gene_type:complete
MNVIEARKIIKNNNLIPGKISKHIIKYINGDSKKLEKKILNYVIEKEIKTIKDKVKKLKSKKKNSIPRNLAIYTLIKEKYKDFSWSKINKHFDISMGPIDIKMRVSLASLLFGRVNSNKSFLQKKYNYKFKKKINLKTQISVKKLFDEANIIYPDDLNFKLFIKTLEKALDEKKIDIISPICPDYSVEYIAPNLYQFTFKELNSGIGVIGKKILKNLEKIHFFFKEHKIKVNHIIAIGDFESLSDRILQKINCSKKDFLKKLKLSQKKFQAATQIRVKTPMFTDLCGGLDEWVKINNRSYQKLKKKKFINSILTHEKIMKIALTRKELYQRWFKNFDEKKIEEIIYTQGAEYVAMGEIIKKRFKNPLVIGADHNRMGIFYKLSSKFPVVYIENKY